MACRISSGEHTSDPECGNRSPPLIESCVSVNVGSNPLRTRNDFSRSTTSCSISAAWTVTCFGRLTTACCGRARCWSGRR